MLHYYVVSWHFHPVLYASVGQDSVVSLVTRYRLHGMGIKSLSIRTGPGAHPASYTMGTGCFVGVKRLKRGIDHPSPSSAEVKELVELCMYSLSVCSWLVVGSTLPLF